MKKLVTYFIIALLSVACNPRLTPVTVDVPKSYLYQNGGVSDSIAFKNQWWEAFGDTTLNRLITTALAENLDLKASASKIIEAQQSLRTLRGNFLPQLGFGRQVEVLHQPVGHGLIPMGVIGGGGL